MGRQAAAVGRSIGMHDHVVVMDEDYYGTTMADRRRTHTQLRHGVLQPATYRLANYIYAHRKCLLVGSIALRFGRIFSGPNLFYIP